MGMAKQKDAGAGTDVQRSPRAIITPPGSDLPEYPVYIALKLYHCDRLLRGLPPNPMITARWLQHLLERLDASGRGMAELQGVTSHFLRERLRASTMTRRCA